MRHNLPKGHQLIKNQKLDYKFNVSRKQTCNSPPVQQVREKAQISTS